MILKCDSELAHKMGPGGGQERVDGTHHTGELSCGREPCGMDALGQQSTRLERQVRVLRRGLHRRLVPKVSWKHTMMAWLVEHAADRLINLQVWRSWTNRVRTSERKEVQAGDGRVQWGGSLRIQSEGKVKDETVGSEVGRRVLPGQWWRIEAAVIGTQDGILRVRLVGWVEIGDGTVKDSNMFEELRGSGLSSRVRSMRA